MANIYDKALEFKKQLEKMDEATLKLITAEYDRTLAKLKNQFIAMSKRASEYSLEHPAPTPYELGRLKEIKQAIEDVEAEVAKLHGKTAGVISKCQEAYMYRVPEHYEELINSLADEYEAENVHFAKVNPEAFKEMAGYTSDGSPLLDVLEKHGGLKKDNIISVLRHGVLVGENPEATARKMVKAGHDDLGHALLVARTETMRVAQEVGNENFKANDIDMVQWVSGETAFTCAACWAMSGKVFKVGEQPHDHPNGRCVFNPYIPELAEMDPDLYKHDPEENFAKLSEEEQLEILGPQRLEMYKSGELKLEDLVSIVDSKKYGRSIKIKSLKDLGLDKSPAELYNIDSKFHKKFNSISKGMQKLFAPYLEEGKVDADFDDSNVSKEEKKSKNYKSPFDLAVRMQEIAETGFDYPLYRYDGNTKSYVKIKTEHIPSAIEHDKIFGRKISADDTDKKGRLKPIFKIIKNKALPSFNDSIRFFTADENDNKAQPIKMATDLLYKKGNFYAPEMRPEYLKIDDVLTAMLIVEKERRLMYKEALDAIKNNGGVLKDGTQIIDGKINLLRKVTIEGEPKQNLTIKEFLSKYPNYNNSFTSFSKDFELIGNIKIQDNVDIEDIISYYRRNTWIGQSHYGEHEFIVVGLKDYKKNE